MLLGRLTEQSQPLPVILVESKLLASQWIIRRLFFAVTTMLSGLR
jgi:hypothetical protein